VDWLIVFDNADDMSLLTSYWPSSNHGSVIVTSRNPFPGKNAFAAKGLHLEPFSVEQGADFLLLSLDIHVSPLQVDLEAARSISARFGGLPLGLRQAAYFMRNKKCLPAAFLNLYNQKHNEIEQIKMPGYTKTVADVWEMSMSTLTQDAADLLDILTVLDPDVIPVQLFRTYDHTVTFTDFLEDTMRYLNATESLADQSLINVNFRDETLSLHRFFQEATFRRLRVREARFQQVYCAVVEMVNHAVPKDDYLSMKHQDAWQVVETYISHANILFMRSFEGVPISGINSLLCLLGKIAG
jgi:hypothetical protein